MEYVWLVMLWFIYFLIHSITAAQRIKNYFFTIGLKPQYYRLLFNTISLITIVPILIYTSIVESNFLVKPGIFTKISGLILASGGLVIIKMAFKSYDLRAFLGLRNLSSENEFTTDGLLKSVRHPLYTGSILLITGYVIYNPKLTTLISAVMMILYFLIGIQFEERKLIKTFGEKYIEYKKNTPMLIPRFRKKE